MILCSKIGRALVAGLFLLLASLQPGLAAAAGNGAGNAVTTEVGHKHDAAAAHDHSDMVGPGHVDGDQHDHDDHHKPAGMDLCCEMHCVMSQAMLAAAPLIQAPPAGRVRADFTHAVPDGQVYSVIKPPRTTS
jgi:hypothetical protein